MDRRFVSSLPHLFLTCILLFHKLSCYTGPCYNRTRLSRLLLLWSQPLEYICRSNKQTPISQSPKVWGGCHSGRISHSVYLRKMTFQEVRITCDQQDKLRFSWFRLKSLMCPFYWYKIITLYGLPRKTMFWPRVGWWFVDNSNEWRNLRIITYMRHEWRKLRIIGESPHEWPKTRYSRQALYSIIISYMLLLNGVKHREIDKNSHRSIAATWLFVNTISYCQQVRWRTQANTLNIV